jgi:hypothetical protein
VPVRSVIDIDVNDAKFKAFQADFAKYDAMLKKMPGAWASAATSQDSMKEGFVGMAAAMMAQLDFLRKKEKAEAEAARAAREQVTLWDSLSRSTKSVAGNIASATSQLLKWTALTSVVSGLLGVGGLFGIERLAGGVASGRRSSLGVGSSFGEQAAFGVNFSRLVDPDSFLGSVNEAQHDVTKRSAFYGAGLREGDIAGRSSAQVGTQLLGALKRIVDATPEAQLQQTLTARHLDQFLSLQDAQRLRSMSPAELAELQGGFRTDQRSLGLSADNQKIWTDFSTQMSRAGGTIENVFVKGLTPLIPSLNSLSKSVTQAVETFLSTPKLGEWIRDLGTGLEKAATYLGSDDFQEKVKKFVEAFGDIVDTVVKVAPYVQHPTKVFSSNLLGNPFQPGTFDGGGNNPGNLRPPGSKTGFQTFATPEEGYKAMARQLKLYADRDHLDTVNDIVSKWAPPSENDTAAYIGDVSKRSGLGATDKLNLNDPDQMARLIAAMAHHENSRNNITPQQVKITLYGAPGGNAVANAQQAATPGQN